MKAAPCRSVGWGIAAAFVAGLGLGLHHALRSPAHAVRSQLLITPETFDIGHCAQGDLVLGEVDIRNATDERVVIGEITTGCGCLRASLPAGRSLAPRGTCRARFEAETSSVFGSVRKRVALRVVEPVESITTFYVQFHVDQGVMTERPGLSFGRVVVGCRATATMILRRVGETEITVRDVLLDGKQVNFQAQSVQADAGSRRTELTINASGFGATGYRVGRVEIDMGDSGPSLFREYRAVVIDRFVVEPRLVGFGLVMIGEKGEERRVLIGDALAREPLTVRELGTDNPSLWTAEVKGTEGGFIVIGVRCSCPKAVGLVDGRLEVTLSEPKGVCLEVPLRANIVGHPKEDAK